MTRNQITPERSYHRAHTFNGFLDYSPGRTAPTPRDVSHWTCVAEDEGGSSPYACDPSASGRTNEDICKSSGIISFGSPVSYLSKLWSKMASGE
mmetsp:Transcript_30982/g.62928  ORF Transcript_30982/g.62928 Transcript_30982/m.62928 type:complete len:94 (-) Transcript_30982:811-1092(-)